MKKVLGVLLIVSVALAVVPVSVNAGLGWFVGGYILGRSGGGTTAGSTTGSGGGDSGIIYEAPRVAERVKNPLTMRMVSINYYAYIEVSKGNYSKNRDGWTLQQIFDAAMKNTNQTSNEFEILQIVRALDGASPHTGAIWFVYTEKTNLRSFEELPKPPQKAKK